MRVVLLQIVLDIQQIIGGGDGPTDAHQALNMASRRASISSSSINSPRSAATNPFSTAAQEAGFFGEITDNNIRHQSLGDGPCFSGDLRNLRLLLGGEVYFHSLQGTKKPRL